MAESFFLQSLCFLCDLLLNCLFRLSGQQKNQKGRTFGPALMTENNF